MKYHNIPFFVACESIQKCKKIGKFLNRSNNTQFSLVDIPEIYNYLKKCDVFTCFVLEIANQIEILDNIIKSINQKNPNFPIILFSSDNISIDTYRHFIKLGANDIILINEESKESDILNDVLKILNLKWRSYLYTKKENEKTFRASVVTINHEINQPLTVILNAIGLLKSELKQEADKDSKVNAHLNFISKGVNRIQIILDNLKNVKKLALKEYTPGVWMVNLDSDLTQKLMFNKSKINRKNSVLVIEKNLEDRSAIENELRNMGLEIINSPNLKDAEKEIDRLIHKIQAVLFSANIPAKELESTLFEINNRNTIVPMIVIRNAEISAENLKLMDSTVFQIINKPVSSKALQEAIANSVIVPN